MTDDNTKELNTGEKIDLILFKVVNIEGRLTALETAAEDRVRETRPKLDLLIKEVTDTRAEMAGINARLDNIEKELRSIDRRFETFSIDHMRMRADIRDFSQRLTELESKPN